MTGRPKSARLQAAIRHWGGFGVSGALAFCTDAAVLELLTRMLSVPPLLARLAAVACAMIVGWQAHRRLTFAVRSKPTVSEFLAYAAVASTSAAINYVVFALILLIRPQTEPFMALVSASLVAMIIAYLGMRLGVFSQSASTRGD